MENEPGVNQRILRGFANILAFDSKGLRKLDKTRIALAIEGVGKDLDELIRKGEEDGKD